MYAFGWQYSLFVTLQGPGMDPENQMEVFEFGKIPIFADFKGIFLCHRQKGPPLHCRSRGIPCYGQVHDHEMIGASFINCC